MTKREFLNVVIAELKDNNEVVEFARGEIAKLDKANENRKGKESKEKKENAEFRAQAWEKIADLEGELTANVVAEHLEISRPKASALLTALEKEGKLTSDLVKEGKNIHKAYKVKA